MTKRLFVKFCGITSIEDALIAQEAGCNAIGFVFVKKSKRHISHDQFLNISKHISPMIQQIGLFADHSQKEISEIVNCKRLNLLQFHGSEPNDFCKQWDIPFWKAIPMLDDIVISDFIMQYPDASGFVLDNFGGQNMAGSGEKFNWELLPRIKNFNWILAGGLNPENIAKAVSITGLNHYDVSSGIESKPGKKSSAKMFQFIENMTKTKT